MLRIDLDQLNADSKVLFKEQGYAAFSKFLFDALGCELISLSLPGRFDLTPRESAVQQRIVMRVNLANTTQRGLNRLLAIIFNHEGKEWMVDYISDATGKDAISGEIVHYRELILVQYRRAKAPGEQHLRDAVKVMEEIAQDEARENRHALTREQMEKSWAQIRKISTTSVLGEPENMQMVGHSSRR